MIQLNKKEIELEKDKYIYRDYIDYDESSIAYNLNDIHPYKRLATYI